MKTGVSVWLISVFRSRWRTWQGLMAARFLYRRREFITLLGSAAAAWPLAAGAQQLTMPVIGFLHHGSPDVAARLAAAFRQGLKEAGFVEGQNVWIEYRWAENHYDRLPALAADLVRRQVAVIFANTFTVQAAKAATATIPIVFNSAEDPVALGLVASFNRPGGNATGVYSLTALEAKRAEIVHELVPKATTIALLVDTNFPSAETQLRHTQEAVRLLGVNLLILKAGNAGELDNAFATLVREHCRRARRCRQRVLLLPARTAGRAGCAPRRARGLSLSRCRCRRRFDELRNQRFRQLSPSRHLRRPHPQG
jgi:putative ABC transport system substrate-binding protein